MSNVTRVGTLARLKPAKAAHYKKLHADPCALVMLRLGQSHVRNYSIYEKTIDGAPVLFSYYEYTGCDLAEDMARVAADPATQRWWKECVPCLEPLPRAKRKGQVWDDMECVYFYEGAADATPKQIRRVGTVTGVKLDQEELYRTLHATPWPGVKQQIRECNIRNYSIFLKDLGPKLYLFSYFEYVGADFDADMKEMALDPTTQRWWKLTDACQAPLPDAAAKKKVWSDMEEVFHTD